MLRLLTMLWCYAYQGAEIPINTLAAKNSDRVERATSNFFDVGKG